MLSRTYGHERSGGREPHRQRQQVADLVREKTDGAVDIKVFPNAQVGADPEYFKGLENGSMPIAFVTSSVIASTVPEAMLFTCRTSSSPRRRRTPPSNGPANQKQTDALEARGIHVLGWTGRPSTPSVAHTLANAEGADILTVY